MTYANGFDPYDANDRDAAVGAAIRRDRPEIVERMDDEDYLTNDRAIGGYVRRNLTDLYRETLLAETGVETSF